MTRLTYLEDDGVWGVVNDRGEVVRCYSDRASGVAAQERLAGGPMRRKLACVPPPSGWSDGFRAGYLEGIARQSDTWLQERIRSYVKAESGSAERFHIESLAPYDFRSWALGLLGVRPENGPDRSVDGRIYFYDEGLSGAPKQLLLSVKSEAVISSDVVELQEALERYGAQIGLFLTRTGPAEDVRVAAQGAGFYVSPWTQESYPRIQILSVAELLQGQHPQYPEVREETSLAAMPIQERRESRSLPPPAPAQEGHVQAHVYGQALPLPVNAAAARSSTDTGGELPLKGMP